MVMEHQMEAKVSVMMVSLCTISFTMISCIDYIYIYMYIIFSYINNRNHNYHSNCLSVLHTCRVNDIIVMLQALKLAVPNHALLLC